MADTTTAVHRTVTLEIELDVDVPDEARLTQETKDEIEAWVDARLLGALDGGEITTSSGARLRVDGHSVVVIPGEWPLR